MDEAIFRVMFAALFLVPIVLIGLLLIRVVSCGVTARKVMYGLLGIALVGLADFGGFVCLMGWAYRHEPAPVGGVVGALDPAHCALARVPFRPGQARRVASTRQEEHPD